VSELDHVGDGRATHAALTTSPGDFSWYLREESARQAASSAELRKGETVLFDRSVLSSIAFQYASQPAVVAVDTLAPLVTKYGPFLLPDAVVILLVDVETSLARRAQSSHNEQYAIWFDRAFLKRYLHFYQAVAASIFPSATFIETSAQMPHATESQVLEVLMHAGIRAEPPITS
jgi:thymidylate kinase